MIIWRYDIRLTLRERSIKKVKSESELSHLETVTMQGDSSKLNYDKTVMINSINHTVYEKFKFDNREKDLENFEFFDLTYWSDDVAVDKVVHRIYESIKEKLYGFKKRQCMNCLKVICLNMLILSRCNWHGYCCYSRNNNKYKANRYNPRKISRKIIGMMDILLEERFLVDHKMGFYVENDEEKSRQSRVRWGARLWNLFEECKVELQSVYKELESRNNGATVIHITRDSIVLRDFDKNDIDYRDNNRIRRLRKNVQNINNCLSGFNISIDLNGNEKEECNINSVYNRLHRVFNNKSFEKGGRFYGHWIQSIPSKFRRKIYIDNESVVELDYSGMHPRMLYAMENVNPLGDVYHLEGYEDQRRLLKCTLLYLISSDSVSEACNAVVADFDKKAISEYGKGEIFRYITMIAEALLDKHEPIRRHFSKDMAKTLQNKDSKITEKILLDMTSKGICCIPIHDSYIVQQQHKDTLRNSMEKYYFDHVGVEPMIDEK